MVIKGMQYSHGLPLAWGKCGNDESVCEMCGCEAEKERFHDSSWGYITKWVCTNEDCRCSWRV